MKCFALFLCFGLCSILTHAQVVINELDADTPSTDDMEFIELLTDAPEQSLNGYVLVLFNGSDNGGDSSYFALDLDGFVSDVNGIFTIGNNAVAPVPDFVLFDNTIQNGADAVAVYQGNESDFPDGTLATTSNLIDALAYDTNDPDDTDLLGLLGLTEQINEGQNGNQTTESIQRNNDGTYSVTTPTPGATNDGSGVVFNGLTITVAETSYEEGDTFTITISSEENVSSDTTISFTLDNGGFDTDDYTGDTSVVIPSGSNTASTDIVIVDDADDEGDEELKITFGMLPEGFNRLNDNQIIRIIDNDFTVASWGTPLEPTFDMVTPTTPSGYYDPIDGLAAADLVQAIQDIIADPDVVRAQTYADVIDILKRADMSPQNSNQVWLVYTEQQRPILDFQTTGSNVGKWNREHTYPRSRGDFNSIDLDDIADGIDIFFPTKADSLRHANSDAHGLRAADGPENSSRGNQDYGEYSGPSGNQGSWQGDVARSIFFLSIRYNGLDVVNGNPPNTTVGELGDLSILLDWHRNDPPDDYEMNRNNVIYEWQFNRNPFIDQPDLAEYIWGTNVGDTWTNTLSLSDNETSRLQLYPNPSKGVFNIVAPEQKGALTIYNTLGQKVFIANFDQRLAVSAIRTAGVYIVHLRTKKGVFVKRMVVK